MALNTYTIEITNNSGVLKDYVLFTGKPEVTGAVQGNIWSNVFATAPTPAGNIATFTISKQFYALEGTSTGSPSTGVTVTVAGTMPVKLGKENDDKTITPGQSVEFVTQKITDPKGAGDILVPSFASAYLPSAGAPNAFQIVTTGPFTPADASHGNWLIGVGASINGGTGPAAMFSPIPAQNYQIKPINTFWLSAGQFVQGTLVEYVQVEKLELQLDFSDNKFPNPCKVNNTNTGEFVVSKAAGP